MTAPPPLPSLEVRPNRYQQAPLEPSCVPGFCSPAMSGPADIIAAQPLESKALQQLTSSMQELIVTQFQTLKEQMQGLSQGQDMMRKDVVQVKDTVSAILERQNEPPNPPVEIQLSPEPKEAKASVVLPVASPEPAPTRSHRTSYRTSSRVSTRKRVSTRVVTEPDAPNMKGLQSMASMQDMDTLVTMVSDTVQQLAADDMHREYSQKTHGPCLRWWYKFLAMSAYDKESVIDIFMGFFICLNALCIGIQMDSIAEYWTGIDVCFSAVFILELTLKLYIFGPRGQFYSHRGAASNIFDACLIVIDLVQLIMKELLFDQVGHLMEDTPSASMFRLVRLVRLVRLLRVLRLPVFSSLISMITGLIGGFSTLVWAIALFGLIVYVVSLMFREFFGRTPKEHISDHFSSVPRSMFTVFRCAFGDCASKHGTPIFEWITEEYGGVFSLFYCAFLFIIGIGLFNVISAIFVESTMAAAQQSELTRKQERIQDQRLWATRVTTLLLAFMEYSGMAINAAEFDTDNDGILDEAEKALYAKAMQSMVDCEIGPETFGKWVADDRVKQALSDLELNPDDNAYLFDIIDCDNSGNIFVAEVIDAIMRLRGEPRRSDIITVDLMVRSLQTQVATLVQGMESLQARG